MASRTTIASFPSIPVGETIAGYESYAAARNAVDQLVRAEFPTADVAIVGSELKSVERVTGRMTAARAAVSGLMSGIMLGVFIGLLLLVISPAASLLTLVSVVLLGIGFSVLWNMVGYAVNRRRKEFTSVMQVVASSFVIVVPPAQAARARSILGVTAQGPVQPAAQAGPAAGSGQPVQAVQSGQAGLTGQTPDERAPEQPVRKRTYAEAQAEMRLERERQAAEQRTREAAETPREPEG